MIPLAGVGGEDAATTAAGTAALLRVVNGFRGRNPN
jgi:hypothetical protein